MKAFLLAGLLSLGSVQAQSPLADAIQKGDREAVRGLLAKEADVNAAQVDGMTALHWAAHRNDLSAAKLLLKAGANANATNRYGITPLSLACLNRNSGIIEILLAAGADPNTRDRGGESMLMIAARAGDIASAKALLGKGADANAKDKRGQTAIMWAAAEGHAEVVDLLLAAEADFRTPLESGFTPLLFAVREGRAEVVKLLLNAGADFREATAPKRRAHRGPQGGMTPLLMAIENGHFELALDLVKAGADPNDQRAGYTALHNITWVRKPNHGEDEDGMPPPAGSGKVNSLDFVRRIAALGADVNARIEKAPNRFGALNNTGATPFLLAAKTADLALLKLLYELGADPTINTKEDVTPVIAAAGYGTLAAGEVAGTEDEVLETLEWLLKNGADVNAVSQQGETAMHGAAYKNLPKVVRFLAAHGAKPQVWNQPNKHGWTPLLIAEGFRPGNFKPSFETIDAIREVLLAAGITPPPPTPADGVNNSDFGPRDRKYTNAPAWTK